MSNFFVDINVTAEKELSSLSTFADFQVSAKTNVLAVLNEALLNQVMAKVANGECDISLPPGNYRIKAIVVVTKHATEDTKDP